MASGGDEVDLQEMAAKVWGALDQLATSDPEQYKKFIDEQMKEGKEYMATPEPVFCLRCPLKGDKPQCLYLNVCRWTRVPKPKTDQDPIPVKGGVVRHLLHEDSKRKTQDLLYDIAFNPDVLEECGKERDLQAMLVDLCLDYVENETKLAITDRTSCEKLKCTHKGPLEDIRNSIDEMWRDQLTPESRLDIGDSLLEQIRDMKVQHNSNSNNNEDALPQLKLFPDKTRPKDIKTPHSIPSEGKRKGKKLPKNTDSVPKPRLPKSEPRKLIEELDESGGVVTSGRVLTPEYELVVVEGGEGGGREVVVRVALPGVGGVKEVELEVSESDLDMSVAECYHLCVRFPEAVREERARATYNTRQCVLTVTIPCLNT